MIRVDADSRELQNADVTLPWERRDGVAEAIGVPGSQEIAIVRGDGAVVKMDRGSQAFADTSARAGLPNRIPPAAWPTSPDGGRVYLGYNSDYDRRSDNRWSNIWGPAVIQIKAVVGAAAYHTKFVRDAVLERRGGERRQDALCHGTAEAQHFGDGHCEDAPDSHPQSRRDAYVSSSRTLAICGPIVRGRRLKPFS
jgi:hypothetical protein